MRKLINDNGESLAYFSDETTDKQISSWVENKLIEQMSDSNGDIFSLNEVDSCWCSYKPGLNHVSPPQIHIFGNNDSRYFKIIEVVVEGISNSFGD